MTIMVGAINRYFIDIDSFHCINSRGKDCLMTFSYALASALAALKNKQQYRQLPTWQHSERFILDSKKRLLNVASNDYLGLSTDRKLQAEFFAAMTESFDNLPKMSAVSSRLITGNSDELQQLEADLEAWYLSASTENQSLNKKSALVINSGYHANLGILPALTSINMPTLILADKLVHASLIDGIKLSQCRHCSYRRYRHNDYEQLATMVAQSDAQRIIIVTESIFSMDGDCADLPKLAAIKAQDARVELYVDEAHAVGVLGNQGLGLGELTGTLADIDYLVGTFGKAFASVGAYVFCDEMIKDWLVNQMRPLIFSTALPPMNHAWSRFILAKMPDFAAKREYLVQISAKLYHAAAKNNQDNGMALADNPITTPIIPYILGSNERVLQKAATFKAAGFYVQAIRPPTVPVNTSRLRLVMTAAMSEEDVARLITML